MSGETAFGFPTIHGSHYTKEEKRAKWLQSGAPGDSVGSKHTREIENMKLVPKENHLQHSIKMTNAKQGRSTKKGQPEQNDI